MTAIKDMEMPKSCWNCDFCCAKDDYYCAISKQRLARKAPDIPSENRPTNCPLTEIVTCKDCEHCTRDIVEGIEYKIKQARDEIAAYYENVTDAKQKTAFNACLMVVDDLISGSEG